MESKSELSVYKRRRIVQPVTEIALVKCGKMQSCAEDRISNLPDEILVSILSGLKIEQAARTSALSLRWRPMWRFTSRLNFEIPNWLRVQRGENSFDIRCKEFMDWVNLVLKSHRGKKLDEFSIRFCLDDKNVKSDIDSWINFALKKRARRVKLDFACFWTNSNWNYPLTDKFLCGYELDSLTSLYLCHVNVTGEDLGYVLSNCPFLEELVVCFSYSLVNFTVSGPSLKLKYLELRLDFLESLEIYNLNLVSFRYSGHKASISVRDTPHLVNASFDGPYARCIVENPILLSSYFSQIETLELDLSSEPQWLKRFPEFPMLWKLRQLKLKLNLKVSCHLLCIYLLRASPLLRSLEIEFSDFKKLRKLEPKLKDGDLMDLKEKGIEVQRPKDVHKCLKVVEVFGFVGSIRDLRTILYIIRSAESLRKIIIDPCWPNKWEFEQDPEKQKVARTHARQHLEARLPLGIELAVL